MTGSSDAEHLQNLSAVFQRLKQNGLRLKKNKCSFFQSSVKYLGHIIDKDGIRPSNDKVKAIQEMPIARDQAKLCSFLGLVTYFSQCFSMLSHHMAPLFAEEGCALDMDT